jgi:hypothetical protein
LREKREGQRKTAFKKRKKEKPQATQHTLQRCQRQKTGKHDINNTHTLKKKNSTMSLPSTFSFRPGGRRRAGIKEGRKVPHTPSLFCFPFLPILS